MKLGGHCPWKSHLYDIEDEAKARGEDVKELYYVLYPDQRGAWFVQPAAVAARACCNHALTHVRPCMQAHPVC